MGKKDSFEFACSICEAVALDQHAHILDRIEALGDLTKLHIEDGNIEKARLCVSELVLLCQEEKEAGW